MELTQDFSRVAASDRPDPKKLAAQAGSLAQAALDSQGSDNRLGAEDKFLTFMEANKQHLRGRPAHQWAEAEKTYAGQDFVDHFHEIVADPRNWNPPYKVVEFLRMNRGPSWSVDELARNFGREEVEQTAKDGKVVIDTNGWVTLKGAKPKT